MFSIKNKYNKILLTSVAFLTIFGIIMIYSASHVWALYKFDNAFKYAIFQLLFAGIGFILMKMVSKIDYKIYYEKANLIILICFVLLILVLIPGLGVVRNGSRSWFSIFSFSIQPSEIAKLGLIIFVSKYLSKVKKINFKEILPVLVIVGLFFGLIMLQPDFGTGMVLVMSIVALLFISGLNMKFFYILGFVGIIGITALIVIAPYRMARITSFIDPWKDPLGSGFQIIQSLYAIGPGGLFGTGFLNSRQKSFYLPEPQTDFIFSIICEEFGVVGALFVIILFIIICYVSIKIALQKTDLFGKYLIFGIIFQIIFQTVLNLSVVIGLIPVTGVTLPFLSYGGSSLVITMIMIGIILNISKQD